MLEKWTLLHPRYDSPYFELRKEVNHSIYCYVYKLFDNDKYALKIDPDNPYYKEIVQSFGYERDLSFINIKNGCGDFVRYMFFSDTDTRKVLCEFVGKSPNKLLVMHFHNY